MEDNSRPVWDGRMLRLKDEQYRKSEKGDVIMLIILFAFVRLMIPWWFTPYYSEFSYYLYPFMVLSNPEFMQQFGFNSGAYPFINYWLEYPPVFPWIAVGIYKLQTLFSTDVNITQANIFSGLVAEFLAVVDVANIYLIYCIGKKIRSHHFAIRAAAAYGLLFFPMVAFASYFDTFVVFTILLAVWALINRNIKFSAAMTGIGFMTKMLPIVLVPVAIKYLILTEKPKTPQPSDPNAAPATPPVPITGTEHVLTYLGVLTVTILVLATPLLFVQKDYVLMPFKVALSRPGWETPRALAGGQTSFGYVGPDENFLRQTDYLNQFAQKKRGYALAISEITDGLGMGGMQRYKYEARIASRFDTDLGYMPEYSDPLKIPLTVIIGAVYLLMLFATSHEFHPARIVFLAGFSFVLLFLWSNGWSPQFIMYLLPFVLVCFGPGKNIIFALVLSAVNFLELPVWLLVRRFAEDSHAVPVLWAAVALRTVLLVLFAVLFAARFARMAAEEPAEVKTEAAAYN